jgi:hypothetical protein
MRFLLFDAPGETAEFVQGALDAMVCTVQLDAVHEGSRLPQASAGTMCDG